MAGKQVAKRKPRSDLGKKKSDENKTFPDGSKPGDIVKYHYEDGEMVGRLVVSTTGGRLWQGKAPNHKAGPGRPPEQIREQARNSFGARIARLEEIIDSPHSSHRDVTSAMALLAKLGVASQVEHHGDRGQPVIILPPQVQPQVLQAQEVQEGEVESDPTGSLDAEEAAPRLESGPGEPVG